jgi:hypothetical protein
MHLDLRLPIGALFTLYGALLLAYGAFGDKTQYARSLELNVNLMWGFVLLAFGVCLLFAQARDRRHRRQGPK